MAPFTGKRNRADEKPNRRPKKFIKKYKKQKEYHSSSEESDDDVPQQGAADFAPVDMDSDEETEQPKPVKSVLKKTATKAAPEVEKAGSGDVEEEEDVDVTGLEEIASEDDDEDDEFDVEAGDVTDDAGSQSEASADEDDEDGEQSTGDRKKRKRNDPTVFANSMSKILSSKLSTSKRADPVLSRSAAASAASRELTDSKLEAKARRKLHAEKVQALERGRVKDVLGLDTTSVSTSGIQEQEKRLKKTAQRGVVKLFNAVRAAQLHGQKAREEVRKEGVVGMAQREERVNEMSKQGFLDLLAQGGKKAPAVNV